jgi:cell division protease FtsH
MASGDRRSVGPFIVHVALVAFSVLILIYAFEAFDAVRKLSYSEFKAAVGAGQVTEVEVSPTLIRGRLATSAAGQEAPAAKSEHFETIRVDDPHLLRDLTAHRVAVTGAVESTLWRDLLSWVVPALVIVGAWLLILRPMGERGGLMAVGRSRAKVYMEKDVKVRFADVAGVDEAKEELREVIEFLKTPEKFRRLGGRIPKGILLVGPPGTGKTLLARAVAGEANVPFFSITGSEFVEMFVGVGAARVRDLFLQAREKAPCIIFVDELDALGKARGIGPMAHEEREQTLNQLLAEMDGFDPRTGVILMAATNRPEILDVALLRAGRFDRHVLVDRPDKTGRLAILKLHARGVALASEADLETIASMTPGFVGADLANLINEAALLAVRREKEAIGLAELQEAVERMVAGLQKKNRILTPKERERVAHHEVGHALVALSLPSTEVVQKISIIPRGIAALGYTMQLPTEDRFLMTQSELENKIAMLLGGRVAEEIVYREVSTGAEDDLRKGTDIARSMVKVYGMSEKLGRATLERERRPLFLEVREPTAPGEYSEETAREIDAEIRRIIDEQHARVTALLEARLAILREAATLLLSRETISGDELKAIMARHALVDRPRDSQAL